MLNFIFSSPFETTDSTFLSPKFPRFKVMFILGLEFNANDLSLSPKFMDCMDWLTLELSSFSS